MRIEQATFEGQEGAWRLSNGEVEAVVVPALGGRLMEFGEAGGGNLLWRNPHGAGGDWGTWSNYGGEKVWPWPQHGGDDEEGWEAVYGRAWPPAAAFDEGAFEAVAMSGELVMTGPVEGRTGLRVRRGVTLRGRQMLTWNELERVEVGTGGREKIVAAPWTVAQVPWPVDGAVEVRGYSVWTNMLAGDEEGWAGRSERSEGGVKVLSLPTRVGRSSKLGADGGELRVRCGARMLRVSIVSEEFGHQPVALQVFRGELKGRPGPSDYIELEAAAPTRAIGTGERSTRLAVLYELE